MPVALIRDWCFRPAADISLVTLMLDVARYRAVPRFSPWALRLSACARAVLWGEEPRVEIMPGSPLPKHLLEELGRCMSPEDGVEEQWRSSGANLNPLAECHGIEGNFCAVGSGKEEIGSRGPAARAIRTLERESQLDLLRDMPNGNVSS